MLTYYSKGQKAEFVMTEQSAVRVESSGVSGNIFIRPLVGKERIISLNFAPFYTQLDDFDAGTIVFLSVDSGFGRVGIEVTGLNNNAVQIVNNQSLLAFKKGNRLTPPTVPADQDGVLFIDQNGLLCTVDKLGNVFELGASRLAPSALAALFNISIFEKSYEMMAAAERIASAITTPATLTFIGSAATTRATNVYTGTAAAIGVANANRRVVVVMALDGAASQTISTATIGGIAATVHVTNTGDRHIAAFSAVIPTGTAADIVVTMSGDLFHDCRLQIYTLDNTKLINGNAPTVVVANAAATNAITVNYTGLANAPSLLIGQLNFSEKLPVVNNRGFISSAGIDTRKSYVASINGDTAGAQSATISWAGVAVDSKAAVLTWETIQPTLGGGYPVFAVSRNAGVADSLTYEVWSSELKDGVYTRDVADALYTPSALLLGSIGYDHSSLAIADEIDFPATITPNSLALIADTAGQQELSRLNGISSITIGNETIKALTSVEVATHYSVPIAVSQDETARIYVLSAYGQDPTLRLGTRFYKVTPKDLAGNIKSLADITAIPFTIANRRNTPNPIRGLKAGKVPFGDTTLNALTFFPNAINPPDPTFSFVPSSKELDVTPASFYNASGVAEEGVVYKVDVEGLNGSSTFVRTLIFDMGTKSVTYTQAQREADGSRLSTKYTFYAEKNGIKSLPLVQTYLQGTSATNTVESIALSQVTSTVKAAFTLSGGGGVERNVYLIELTGTLLPNVNTAGITISGVGASILEFVGNGFQFYVQSGKGAANFELTIPYTGGVANVLTVTSGTTGDTRTQSITII